MSPCPRCGRANALVRETDRWGSYLNCWTCGFNKEEIDGEPFAWSPHNPHREYLDPVVTAGEIERAKREYQRAYRARKRATA